MRIAIEVLMAVMFVIMDPAKASDQINKEVL